MLDKNDILYKYAASWLLHTVFVRRWWSRAISYRKCWTFCYFFFALFFISEKRKLYTLYAWNTPIWLWGKSSYTQPWILANLTFTSILPKLTCDTLTHLWHLHAKSTWQFILTKSRSLKQISF
jgi:hypothetical protein